MHQNSILVGDAMIGFLGNFSEWLELNLECSLDRTATYEEANNVFVNTVAEDMAILYFRQEKAMRGVTMRHCNYCKDVHTYDSFFCEYGVTFEYHFMLEDA